MSVVVGVVTETAFLPCSSELLGSWWRALRGRCFLRAGSAGPSSSAAVPAWTAAGWASVGSAADHPCPSADQAVAGR